MVILLLLCRRRVAVVVDALFHAPAHLERIPELVKKLTETVEGRGI